MTQTQAETQVKRELGKPAAPEATALLVNLLARYASNVPDKTELDRRVEAALRGSPGSREAAQRIVGRFQKIPLAERQAIFGSLANISTEAFPAERYEMAIRQIAEGEASTPGIQAIQVEGLGEAKGVTEQIPSPQPATVDLAGGQPTYVLKYVGLCCHKRTGDQFGGKSDEPYVITSVTTVSPTGESVVRTEKHPNTREAYGDVDSGDVRSGPVAPCWGGPLTHVSLASAVIEHDRSDPNALKSEVDTAVKAAADAFIFDNWGDKPGGLPKPIWEILFGIVADVVNAILGLGDDLIQEQYHEIPALDLAQIADTPLQQGPDGIRHHFSIRHRGEGADYEVYYRVERLGGPPVIENQIHWARTQQESHNSLQLDVYYSYNGNQGEDMMLRALPLDENGQSLPIQKGFDLLTKPLTKREGQVVVGPALYPLRLQIGYNGGQAFTSNAVRVQMVAPGGRVIAARDFPVSNQWKPSPQALQAEFVSQNVPKRMDPGREYEVTVQFKNTGSVPWTRADKIKLGSWYPQDNLNWKVGRVYLEPGETIRPGQIKTFRFKVRASSEPGRYDIGWRMLKERVRWFGSPTSKATVTVGEDGVGEELPPPRILSPENNAELPGNTTEVTLRWAPVAGAGSYDVRVRDETDPNRRDSRNNCGGNKHYLCVNGWKSTSITVRVRRGNRYHAWVHARNAAGTGKAGHTKFHVRSA